MLIWACAGIGCGCGCAKAEDLEQSTLGSYLAALKEASETEISCKYKALLTDAERSDMQGLTRACFGRRLLRQGANLALTGRAGPDRRRL